METSSFAYKRINLIIAVIITGVFIYSGIFSHRKENHPIPSAYKLLTGKNSVSTGLSRSFSAIMRFDLSTARQLNPHGISLFVFFLTQFILRIFFYSFIKNPVFEFDQILTIDIVISSGLFLIHFEPFIKDLFYR